MEVFFTYDPQCIGVKGLVVVEGKLLAYQRDQLTTNYPFCIDLPGGGAEADDTSPFQTFKRELLEEFNLELLPKHIQYVRRYTSRQNPGKYSYFPVALLPSASIQRLKLGAEGLQHMWLSFDEYLASQNLAWPTLKRRVMDYLETQNA